MASEHEKAMNDEHTKQQLQRIDNGQWHCCMNCTYWQQDKCSFFRELPPLLILTVGCESWCYLKDVPF